MNILRPMMVLLVVIGVLGPSSSALAGQDGTSEHLADLAAMALLPQELDEPGYQLARGGYLSVQDARFLIAEQYSAEPDTVENVLDAARWRQGYTQALVLLEDRAIRTSSPLATVGTTIHAFPDDERAELVEALMSGAIPGDAETLASAVDNAVTYRIVTSQDDRLVTVVRSDRFVFEIVSADATGTPDADVHAGLVQSTLARAQSVTEASLHGLSQQIVTLEDSRLIPLAIQAEAPLVHVYYRLVDGMVVPVAGELDPPARGDLPEGVEEIVVSRQTAELASQTWMTAGVIVLDFSNDASAMSFAETGVIDDPLDFFAVDETSSAMQPITGELRIETLSGESSVGGRFSGFRMTIQDGSSVAQLVIRAMGNTRLDQASVEGWALAQGDCLAEAACDPIMLTDLVATPDPATPVAGGMDDGVYRSPVAAWSVEFSPNVWRVEEVVAEGGYDYLYLRSEQMDATFETVVNQHGDPEQCVLDELDRLRELEDRAAITLGSDDPDEGPGGMEAGHGWVMYTVEPLEVSRAAEEYTLRIDCYTVFEGTTSLVVQVRAPRDAWAEVSEQGDELRSRIDIDGLPESGNRMTPGRIVMDNRTPWPGIAA